MYEEHLKAARPRPSATSPVPRQMRRSGRCSPGGRRRQQHKVNSAQTLLVPHAGGASVRVNQNQHPSWTPVSADSLRGWPKPASLTSCSSGAS
ncbi:unnamed protein product [Pleuronectes platessa]|uniref:Uncharacterized protein n=1 Tax=Pleuronectes platessa TaxID=8262 RepID=A0A9N7Y5G8_PLEPL|nr:unnamed protein product [Pleuronectes platessa]